MCGHVTSGGVQNIRDHVAAYLFGGVTSLRSRKELYVKLVAFLRSHGVVQEGGPLLPDLIPEYTDQLVELVYRWISKPWASILVPQFLQFHALQILTSNTDVELEKPEGHSYNEIVVKFADDIINFISTTTDVYREKIV